MSAAPTPPSAHILADIERALKRALDVGVSSSILLVTAPLSLGVAAAIAATMGRPIFYSQERTGQHGRPFRFLKFRTMRQTERGEDPIASHRARLTPLGAFLRATSLDELPSLIHVVRGEMSLVGPRPLLPQYRERYTAYQSRRHEVTPGVTGWAQIHGRNRLAWEDRLDLDVWYVEHWSLPLDLRILWRTLALALSPGEIASEFDAASEEFKGSGRDV